MLMYISEPYKIQNENRYKIQIDIDIRYKNYYSKCKSTIRHENILYLVQGWDHQTQMVWSRVFSHCKF